MRGHECVLGRSWGSRKRNPAVARTVRDVRLDSRTVRDRLVPRKKPYYRVIETGKHIGYYKGLRTGSWLARTYDGGRYTETKLGMADDTLDANGMDVLSFSEAQAAARAWFDALAQREYGAPAGPYSISDACDDYLRDYKHRRGKDEYNTGLRLSRIKEALGAVKVRKLTAAGQRQPGRRVVVRGLPDVGGGPFH